MKTKLTFECKGMNKMVKALNVGNNILLRAFEEKIDITPMKLQKLVYFIYRQYLKETGHPLFNERFEVWKYGPVVRSIYDEFKVYRSNKIDNYYRESDGSVVIGSEDTSQAFKQALDEVWNQYKYYDGMVLSEITHKQDSAWRKALDKHECYLNDEDIKEERSFVR